MADYMELWKERWQDWSTQRKRKFIIVIALFVVALASWVFFSGESNERTMQTKKMGSTAGVNPAEAATTTVKVIGMENVKSAAVRDVFNMPVAYRDTKITETEVRNNGGTPGGSGGRGTTNQMQQPKPVLTGIAGSNGRNAALLTLNGKTDVYYAGDKVGSYSVIEVGGDYVVLSNSGGKTRVPLSNGSAKASAVNSAAGASGNNTNRQTADNQNSSSNANNQLEALASDLAKLTGQSAGTAKN